jgi:hypothetical protein
MVRGLPEGGLGEAVKAKMARQLKQHKDLCNNSTIETRWRGARQGVGGRELIFDDDTGKCIGLHDTMGRERGPLPCGGGSGPNGDFTRIVPKQMLKDLKNYNHDGYACPQGETKPFCVVPAWVRVSPTEGYWWWADGEKA